LWNSGAHYSRMHNMLDKIQYLLKLAAKFYWKTSYLLGEKSSFSKNLWNYLQSFTNTHSGVRLVHFITGWRMDKLQLTGQNLGRVLYFRLGHLHAEHFWCYQVKLPNLKLKTRPKQLLGSLPLVIALPAWSSAEFSVSLRTGMPCTALLIYETRHLKVEHAVQTTFWVCPATNGPQCSPAACIVKLFTVVINFVLL
jgi:hypothetical protein